MTEQPDRQDEQQIIALILGGEKQLFHDLIRPYERGVYVMALSLLRNEADAEEVAQEAFLKAFRNLADFRGAAKFSTWLISITLNEARMRLRRNNRVRTESLEQAHDEEGHIAPALLRDWKEIPSEALERKEVLSMLRAAIASLPSIYREVLILRDVEELSTAEAAQILDITVASVKVRLHRARLMMQKILAPQLKSLNPRKRWLQCS